MSRPLFLLVLASLLCGCYSTTPVYYSDGTGPAGSVTYFNPSWETSINPIGWGLVVVATAGGAYAGYESGLEFEWETGATKSEKPEANAAIAGVSAGLSTMILNSIFKPDAPVYRTELAEEWLDDFDENLALIGASKRSGNEYVDAIDRAWERAALPSDTIELRIFSRAFPGSIRIDEVERHAATTFDRATLPNLAAMLGNTALADTARYRYVRESETFDDVLAALKDYPDLSFLAEERAFALANGRKDVERFVNRFPGSNRISALVDREMEKLDLADLQRLLPFVDDPEVRDRIGRRTLENAVSLYDVIEVSEKFPGLAGEAEVKATEIATTAGDFRLFLATWPESSEAAGIKAKLMEKLRVPENLGDGVNSDASEYSPVITPDGSTLYITRRYTYDNVGTYEDEDIWISTLLNLDSWSRARNLTELNSWRSNSVNSVTPDGNTLLLHGDYTNFVWESPASLTHRTPHGWSQPVALDIENYYNAGRYTQSFLANDGRTLLLAVERREGRGNHDLYVCFLESDGSWTRPKNLGRTINTRRADDSPFLASDGRTLYFASEGHGGEGGSDIFMSRRVDDSWTKWTTPKNLGRPINTSGDDSFFFIPASGDVAYFSSDESGFGESDIFRVALPDDRQPLPVVLIAGTVRDRATGEPVEATIVYEDLATGREIGRARTDPSSGLYKLTLPPGANYGFRAEAPDYLAISDNLDLSELRSYREQTRDLELVPIRSGETVRLNNLFFDFGRSTLRRESHPELRRLASVMKERPEMTIQIIGHTDSIGVADDNLRLSRSRAEAVASYLAGIGISRSRLSVVGRGEEEPVASNGTEEGRAENRRVEVRVE